jgi:hypothetical protein
MPNVLVRDLPDDVHRQVTRGAQAAGLSLQQYLTTELTRLARKPSLDEIINRIDQHHGGTVGLDQAIEDLDAERAHR